MKDYIKSRPQELCLMCGRCCKVTTIPLSHKEILSLYEEGDSAALDFLDLFEPYSSIGAAKEIDEKTVNNILKYSDKKEEEITFYRCKYILENNLCGKYDDRPELCRRFPATCWAVIPPECGYEKFLLNKQKETIEKVKGFKQLRSELEHSSKVTEDPKILERNEQAINKINNFIKHYSIYGSEHW